MSISNSFKRVLKGRAKAPVWLMAAVLVAVIGMVASARTWLISGPSINATAMAMANHPPTPATITRSPTLQEQAVIRLLTSGFSSTEVTGSAGHYRLVATRTSREEEVVLQVKTEVGELVQDLTMPQEKLDWTTTIELQSGSYNLTVTNHPSWVCHITVQ
jgi:hypothetical protein